MVKTYSGGMRRRLDLGAALVARAPVLFLDEPTTGLDPRSRLGLWDVIEELSPPGRPCCSRRSTWTRPTAWPTGLPSSTTGLAIAQGTSDELKAQVGGERLEIRAGGAFALLGGGRSARGDD